MIGPDGEGLVIVCDQLAEIGGLERLVATACEHLPAARLVALRFDARPGASPPAWARDARLIGDGGPRRHFLAPLYARRVAHADLGDPRAVLAFSSAGWGLAAPVPDGTPFVAFVPAVPRAFAAGERWYLGEYPAIARPLLRAAKPLLRRSLSRLLRRPDTLLTNGVYSSAALHAICGRRAAGLAPPVRTALFTPPPDGSARSHLLAVGRLVDHKRMDEVLGLARNRPHERVVVAGDGPRREALARSAPANVTFTGRVSDERLCELYRDARAVLVPSVEEFGIVAAEALACGTPVIAPDHGGVLDIVDGPGLGVLTVRTDAVGLGQALDRLDAEGFDADACRTAAERFSEEVFVGRLRAALDLAAAPSAPRAAEHHEPSLVD